MEDYKLSPTLCVMAQMGCGKTKALRTYIDNHFNDKLIRFVTFRQTFSKALNNAFPDFTLYSNITGNITFDIKQVIIQVESLFRLQVGNIVDLLILDEVESIIGQFNSGLHKNFNASFAIFQWMLSTAKHVICMDANLSDRTYRTLKHIRPQHDIVFHCNQFAKAIDDKYYFTQNRGHWLLKLFEFIRLDKKIVLPTNSLTEAKICQLLIKEHFPNKHIQIYSSEMSTSEKNKHFADVTKYWGELDILIYTPTCSAGISFEIEHFDVLFGYFSDSSCEVETCRQMLGRVRQLSLKSYYICFQSYLKNNLPTTIEDITENLYAKKSHLLEDIDQSTLQFEYTYDGKIKYYESNYFHMWLETVRIINLSKNNFIARFINQVADTKAQVIFLEPMNEKATSEIISECLIAKSEIKNSRASAIAVADNLTSEEVNLIREKIEIQQDIVIEEYYACEKFYLKEIYKIDFNLITQDFVLKYNNDKIKKIYKNLCKICEGTTIYESLIKIKQQELLLYMQNIQLFDENYTRENYLNENYTHENYTHENYLNENYTHENYLNEIDENYLNEIEINENNTNKNYLTAIDNKHQQDSQCLKEKNNFIIHCIINQILQICGFKFTDVFITNNLFMTFVSENKLEQRLRAEIKIIGNKLKLIASDINLPNSNIIEYIEKINYNVNKSEFIKNMLKIINSVIRDIYGIEIKLLDGNYCIIFGKNGKLFTFNQIDNKPFIKNNLIY